MRSCIFALLAFACVSLSLLYSGVTCVAAGELGFTHNFETGDLTGWTIVEGNAWDFQPTLDDNSTARGGGGPSRHEGDWWIGGYEKYQGKGGQNKGDVQGDVPQGILESIPFTIIGVEISFMIGGGNHPWDEDPVGPTCVNLEINGEMVRTATGAHRETLATKSWDVSDLKGETAVIRLYDKHTAHYGHINFDNVYQVDADGEEIPWRRVLLAVRAAGKLSTVWGAIKL